MNSLPPASAPFLLRSPRSRPGGRAFAISAALGLALAADFAAPASAKPPGGPPPLGTLALDVWSDGSDGSGGSGGSERLHLLIAVSEEVTPGTPGLRHLASVDGGETWSEPVAVGEGQAPPFSPHRGMDPQIAGRGDRLVAAWMIAGTGFFGSGPIATAVSADGGRTWEPGPNPADHDSTEGHGFMDLAVDDEGVFHLVWLDNREGRRGLRHAESSDGGRHWSSNATIDPETCECCWNTLALWADGTPAVLYRAKSPRDMALSTRFPASGEGADPHPLWSQAVAVGGFGWRFEGCPHVGGGLALVETEGERTAHAAVWTGQEGRTGVHHLWSRDGGLSWSEPLPFGESGASHPDLAAASDGRVAVAWSEPAEGGRRIRATGVGSGGVAGEEAVTLSSEGRFATHPRIVPAGGGFRVFWTESHGQGGEHAWRSAFLDLSP